jgi:hypothetical protein
MTSDLLHHPVRLRIVRRYRRHTNHQQLAAGRNAAGMYATSPAHPGRGPAVRPTPGPRAVERTYTLRPAAAQIQPGGRAP